MTNSLSHSAWNFVGIPVKGSPCDPACRQEMSPKLMSSGCSPACNVISISLESFGSSMKNINLGLQAPPSPRLSQHTQL